MRPSGPSFKAPERLLSPYTVLKRQTGNSFEVATVLASFLIGAGFSAYVVVGYATADVCNDVRKRRQCSETPDERPPTPPEVEVQERKYKLTPLPDLRSKYLLSMEEKARLKEEEIENRLRLQQYEKLMEKLRPPPDELHGWRFFSWVLMVPPERDVIEPFFINAVSGERVELTSEYYLGIESVYDHTNYYVNLQDNTNGLGKLSYDLGDTACWEHLLPGEPMKARKYAIEDESFLENAMMEKHLDMPYSWVERLDISNEEFKKRYPGGHKYDEFEKTIIEKFAPYQRVDGLVKLIKTYEDHEYQMQLKQYEWYENRADKMIKITRDLTNNRIVESFDNGRKDYLKEHTYDGNSEVGSIEANRTLEFNHYSRADHLKLVKMTNHLLYEEYQDREDKLCSREIFYGEEVSNSSAECSKRDLLCVKEIFSRNADIPATDDIAEREFDFSSNQIRMVFHYEENFITRSTRSFVKPNTAEAGGRILFFPELTEGYIANPNGKHPSHLKLYHLLCDSMKAENEVRRHVRDYEIELGSIMRSRQLELDQPEIKVHLFDTERNEFAKQGLQEKRAAVAHQMESDLESSVEHVSVYAARMFGRDWRDAITRPLSKSEAVMMRAQCLTDFKVRQLARQTVVQERYKENNSKWFAKKMWYLSNQYTLAPAAEEEYFRNNAILAFRDHVLEVQLTRYSDLSKERYKALELYLSHHPMMTALDEED